MLIPELEGSNQEVGSNVSHFVCIKPSASQETGEFLPATVADNGS